MAIRSLPAEKQAIAEFQKTSGKLPSNSEDWAKVHRIAYPSINDLPDEFKNDLNLSMYQGGTVQPKTVDPISGLPKGMQDIIRQQQAQQDYLKTTQEYKDREAAQANIPDPNAMRETLMAIQKGIRTKMDYQNAPLDTSTLFNAAGLTGFENLSQALNQRRAELDQHQTTLENVLSETGGAFKGLADRAKQNWDMANAKYKEMTAGLTAAMDEMRANEKAIAMANLNHKLSLQLEEYKRQNPSFSDQINAADRGYTIQNGNLLENTDINKGIVGGFNIKSYATDPNHEQAIASILQGIGKFNELTDVESYIKRKYPNSPVSADMISKASEKHGIPWEMLVAMMEQDSSMGTQGKAVRTRNPGNVGNTDSGATKTYASWQDGVNAVADWLSRKRVKTVSTDQASKFTPEFYATKEGQKVRDDERALQQIFLANQTVKDFQNVQSQYRSMDKVLTSGVGGPGDLDLVYSFMKGLDPNSVVRETEYATAAKSGNIFKGWAAKFNGYLKENGGFLPDDVKKSFLDLVGIKMDVKKQGADDLRTKMMDQAKRQGLNPENVTIDFTLPKSDEQPKASQNDPLGLFSGSSSNSNDPLGIR